MVDRHEFEPEHAFLSSITPTPSLPAPSPALEFTDDVCELLSLPPPPLSTSLACSEDLTSLSSPTTPSPSETPTSVPAHSLPPLCPSPGESCYNLVLGPFATPVSSHIPESPPSSLDEPIHFLPMPLGSMTIPISPHSTPSQRLPELKMIGSISTQLEVTPAPASPAIPFVPQSQELSTVHEVSLTLVPRFPLTSPPLTLSHSGHARFHFAFIFITTAVLVSAFFNISATLFTHTSKFRGKQDIIDIRIDTLKASSCDAFTHRLRLSHQISAPEDSRKRKSKTCGNFFFFTTLDTGLPHSRSIDRLIIFDPGGVGFVLEPAHEDLATFDEDARRRSSRTMPPHRGITSPQISVNYD
ncbi:hypothetical protein EDB89DRAFT_2233440 [Lactarius sanguifluus]|nr:hypothetical protein EDB89DRAFT_2233440 [Lactarius sanguifluus]